MSASRHADHDERYRQRERKDVPREDYILIVDDDPGISEMLAMVLHDEEGFAVQMASTLRQVLSRPPLRAPRMLLLDATLPGENVLLTGAEVRRLPGWRDTPIVLCSGRDDIAHVARELHAAACLRKPFDLDELVAIAQSFAG